MKLTNTWFYTLQDIDGLEFYAYISTCKIAISDKLCHPKSSDKNCMNLIITYFYNLIISNRPLNKGKIATNCSFSSCYNTNRVKLTRVTIILGSYGLSSQSTI